MQSEHTVVVGAGIGGLAAAITLAARGIGVTLVERLDSAGGKMREIAAGSQQLDAGPTVMTMPWVFDQLFALASTSLSEQVGLTKLETLARHAWPDGSRLDLFADVQKTATAIESFADAREADGYQHFVGAAAKTFEVLKESFMEQSRPSPMGLALRTGIRNLYSTSPFSTLHGRIRKDFRDPRLQQLFGRYATYCGSSPYFAPATLACIAHAEQAGVLAVSGGMQRLVDALLKTAIQMGVQYTPGFDVSEVMTQRGRVCGVRARDGREVSSQYVIANADVSAIGGGLIGDQVRSAARIVRPRNRSLSAVTWHAHAKTRGFPLVRHNVFFSSAYRQEFDQIFGAGQLPSEPTIYVCAQDRYDQSEARDKEEKIMILVNAPAMDDVKRLSPAELRQCRHTVCAYLERLGLTIEQESNLWSETTPQDFAEMFPGSGGALYGRASHGWRASFQRPNAKTRIPGLYLAGGSVHPGPGIPMAALSGQIAATRLLKDLDSISR